MDLLMLVLVVIISLTVGFTIYNFFKKGQYKVLGQASTYGFGEETYNKIGSGNNSLLYTSLLIIIYVSLISFILLSSVFKGEIFQQGQALGIVETIFIFAVLLIIIFMAVIFFLGQDYGTTLLINGGRDNLIMNFGDTEQSKSDSSSSSGLGIRTSDKLVSNGLFVIYKDKSYDYAAEYEYDNQLNLNNRLISVTITGSNLKEPNPKVILLPNMDDVESYFSTYKNYLIGHIHIYKEENELEFKYVITLNNHTVASDSFYMNDPGPDGETSLLVYVNKLDYRKNNFYRLSVPKTNNKRYKWPYNSKDSNSVSYKIN